MFLGWVIVCLFVSLFVCLFASFISERHILVYLHSREDLAKLIHSNWSTFPSKCRITRTHTTRLSINPKVKDVLYPISVIIVLLFFWARHRFRFLPLVFFYNNRSIAFHNNFLCEDNFLFKFCVCCLLLIHSSWPF